MKKFNITGTCFPNRHHMVDLTSRIAQIKAMVDDGAYFFINRGRQFGKTTTLNALREGIASVYEVYAISIEGMDDASYETERHLAYAMMRLFEFAAFMRGNNVSRRVQEIVSEVVKEHKQNDQIKIDDFSIAVSQMCMAAQKKESKSRTISISNRVFETIMYDLFIAEDDMGELSKEGSIDKNQFIKDGGIDMEHLLARFAVHFNDIYSHKDDAFVEKMGRKLFLLYLKTIINGVGNYYIENQTRDETRTDVVIDYLGKQYIIELKIWRDNAYNERGEHQIAGYLDYFHVCTGYLLSFCFNKNKQPGVKIVHVDDKTVIECMV